MDKIIIIDKAYEKLKELKIKPSVSGYRYLVLAIVYVIENIKTLDTIHITKEVYSYVASTCNTNLHAVERNIRHAIQTCKKQCSAINIEKVTGSCITDLTNKDLIWSLARKIYRELKHDEGVV